ncbi:MAG: TlpA family protein disulfide reductase [Bacteroidales bacterium]|nr:TlpA family protein disulfide reductase [Bacteroidales bacterium]
MKTILLSLTFALLANVAHTSPARLIGSVDNYTGEGYVVAMFTTSQGRIMDTLKVQPNGTFEFSRSLENPTAVLLHLEYYRETPVFVHAHMANGKTNRVRVTTSTSEAGRTVFNVEYSGDNVAESEFLQARFDLITMPSPKFGLQKAGSFATFREFRAYVQEELSPLRRWLEASDTEFRTANTAVLNQDESILFFRFAWAQRQKGERIDADADFVNFVRSVDLNDENNVQLAGQVFQWHLGIEENPDNESTTIRRLRLIERKVTNQAMANRLARDIMRNEMSMGGGPDLSRVYELYRQVASDADEQEDITNLYNQLVRLVKGAPAMDFEMQDVNGNTVRFFDVIGQGKVVYVDFWATWCGPCRLEKPHFKRLAEKHKDNPNIEFISISLDNNLRRWHAFLEAEPTTLRQFVIPDNFNSEFARKYNVRGIPRFMAFDKNGKIISINAPRPSSPEIEGFLAPYLE